MTYEAKDFNSLLGMDGFSDELLKNHFSLYEGYVSNTNEILKKLAALSGEGKSSSPEYAEMRRRLGWEWNGIRLHELYFNNLGGEGKPADGDLASSLQSHFGGFEEWKSEFQAIGGMRGIGWVILYHDPVANRLLNFWIDEHATGHPAGCTPIVVMDVWEHAFMIDYGTDKKDYIEAFFRNLNWDVAERRVQAARSAELAIR